MEVTIHDSDPVVFPKTVQPVITRVMKVFFEMGRPLAIDEISSFLSLDMSNVQYCIDLLIEYDFIVQTRAGFESAWTERDFPDFYALTPRGREYVFEIERAECEHSKDGVQ